MINEKINIINTRILSKDKLCRYMFSKSWDDKKDSYMIITIYPGTTSLLSEDTTTRLIFNGLTKYNIGSIVYTNLYPHKDYKKLSKTAIKENDDIILQYAKDCKKIIFAWGTLGNTCKTTKERTEELLKLLDSEKDKFHYLTDESKEKIYHPLNPKNRNNWFINKYNTSK